MPNARHHPPRTQHMKHSSLADESDAVRGRVHAVVRWRAALGIAVLALHVLLQLDVHSLKGARADIFQ